MSTPESQRQGALKTMEDEIDLHRLWALLVDARWLIIGITLLALLLGGVYAYEATPIYEADGLLQIEKNQTAVPGFQQLTDALGQEEPSTDAQIAIIQSRMVLGDAADQLNMAIHVAPKRTPFIGRFFAPAPAAPGVQVPLFAGYRDSQSLVAVDSFTVPDGDLGKTFTLKAGPKGQPQLLLGGRMIASGPADKPLKSADGTIELRLSDWKPGGQTFTVTRVSKLAAVSSILSRLSVSERGKGTGILNISLTGPNPARIKKVLDAINQAYLLQNVKRQAAQAEGSLDFLKKQLPDIKDKLNKAEDALSQYRTKSDSVDIDMETKALLSQLVSKDSQINELKIKESEVASKFTKNHPAYKTLIKQHQDLEAQKARINKQISHLPATQQKVLRMMQDVQVQQQLYVSMLNQIQELKILKASTVGNVRIIDDAVTLPSPIKPKKGMLLALSGVLGLLLSAGYVLAAGLLRRGVESPDQLEEIGVPVYAAVPLSEHQQKVDRMASITRRRKRGAGGSSPLLAVNDPADPAVESLRSLRTSLHFATMEASNRVLMISGPSPQVGKSFITANLGAVLAQVGQKVVVVDADMRKGHLHRYFEHDGRNGLSDYLSGQAALEQIINDTKVDNLHFIARGQVPPNPSELLMHPRFKTFIEELSNQYDLVLLDTPPILAVTDAAIIGQLAGTSLMVARYAVNSVKEVDVSMRRFDQNRVDIKGVIFNCIERRASTEYYGYYTYRYESDKS